MPTKKYKASSNFLDSITNAELSPISKRLYLERWRTLMQHKQQDVFSILKNPTVYVPWIMDHFDAPQTQKSYLSAVLAMFRHNEGLKEQEKRAYDAWYEAFQQVKAVIDAKYKNNEPSDRQLEGYVEFEDITKKRDQLESGSDERLLLAFYTYIPPLRCDLNEVRIFQDEALPHDPPKNFLQIAKGGAPKATLVLTEFKTAKSVKEYRKELPAQLVKEILTSLTCKPRQYVFVDRNLKPYRASSFRKWANRVLARLFDKPLTISLIRHAFINSLDFNALTIAEKEEIAKDMAHTVGMQDQYRLIFRKPR